MDKLILEEIQRMSLLSKYDNSRTLTEQGDGSAEFRMNRLNQQQLKDAGVAQAATKESESLKAWTKYPCVVNNPNAKKTKDKYGSIVYLINGVYYYNNGRKMLADKTMANFTCNDAEFKSGGSGKTPAKPVATPPELKDIKAFQDWLDTNAKGWATGYKDGIINKGQNGGGYGKYGPRTQKAWATYKDQFLKGGTTTQAPPEIEGEDTTQTIDPNDAEFGGGATTPSAEQPATVATPPTNDQAVTLQGNPKSAITNGQPEKPTSAIYGQEYKASDGKTYVWSGTEYQQKSQPVKIGPNQET